MVAGTRTSRRISATQSSVDTPSISASGCRPTRWRIVAGASAFTSSGMTKSRPALTARACAPASSAIDARGDAPK